MCFKMNETSDSYWRTKERNNPRRRYKVAIMLRLVSDVTFIKSDYKVPPCVTGELQIQMVVFYIVLVLLSSAKIDVTYPFFNII